MNVKSILLGSAAGLAVISMANAADLPSRKAASVEYVRICSEHGQGFFYIPGSDTCLKVGGRVIADTQINQARDRNTDAVQFGSQGRMYLDARNSTPYGTLRVYVRYQLDWGNGNLLADYATAANSGAPNAYPSLNKGFIQFAGLTAGRITSFFDFYANFDTFTALRVSDHNANVLGYTATFGDGFTASLAIEDGVLRRSGYAYYDFGGPSGSIHEIPSAGQSVPDVVGNIRVDQGWGAARLAAALHQVRPAYTQNFSFDNTHDTKYGFAVSGGLKINLPFLAPGSEFWFEGTYADGALAYLGMGGEKQTGGARVNAADAFIDLDGKVVTAEGYSLVADLLHYWTPSIRQNVFASYANVKYGRKGYETVSANGMTYNSGIVDFHEVKVGTNLIWSPLKSFDIGAEIFYSRLDPKGRVPDFYNPARTISSDDTWQGRLRILREF